MFANINRKIIILKNYCWAYRNLNYKFLKKNSN